MFKNIRLASVLSAAVVLMFAQQASAQSAVNTMAKFSPNIQPESLTTKGGPVMINGKIKNPRWTPYKRPSDTPVANTYSVNTIARSPSSISKAPEKAALATQPTSPIYNKAGSSAAPIYAR